MYLWLFNVYMAAVMKEVKIGMGRREERGDCLASCMHMQITWFCVVSWRKTSGRLWDLWLVCRRRSSKVSAGKSKVKVLGGKEGWSVRFA